MLRTILLSTANGYKQCGTCSSDLSHSTPHEMAKDKGFSKPDDRSISAFKGYLAH